MIGHGFSVAEHAESELLSLGWTILSSASLGIICFRYEPVLVYEMHLDRLNATISQQARARNVAVAFTTRIRGKTAIGMCTISPELTLKDMGAVARALDTIARDLAIELHLRAV
jgi:L-2,4-diaminobutyrate decarboxylase